MVDAPDIHYHSVADKKLIKEIDHAPRDVLSLQAAAKTKSNDLLKGTLPSLSMLTSCFNRNTQCTDSTSLRREISTARL
jgi:hypothetical protein